MAEIANNNQITQLLALSDEISNVNLKIKQLVEELHSTSEHIGNLKSLTDVLTSKAGAINNEVMGYTPGQTPDNSVNGVPSWQSEGSERQRIVPTPENAMQYVDAPAQPVATPTVPEPALTKEEVKAAQQDDFKSMLEKNSTKKRPTGRKKTRRSNTKKSAGFFGGGRKRSE